MLRVGEKGKVQSGKKGVLRVGKWERIRARKGKG